MADQRTPSPDDYECALRRAWFPVARSADLPAGRGQPGSATLLGVHLAIFRRHDGQAAILADACPHRGASLSAGRVDGDAVRCPYHGWRWAGDGRCLEIPSLPADAALPPGAAASTYRSIERYGLIWCCLERPAVDPPTFAAADEANWICAAGDPFRIPVGPATLVENFRDVAHFSFVHRATLGEVPPQVESLNVERDGLTTRMHRRTDLAGAPDAGWGSITSMDYEVQAPAFATIAMHTDRGDRFLIGAPSPIGTEECVNYWVEGFSPGYDELTLEEALEFEARVYAEDEQVLKTMRQREIPLDPSEQVHTIADAYTLAYRQALVEFIRRSGEVS